MITAPGNDAIAPMVAADSLEKAVVFATVAEEQARVHLGAKSHGATEMAHEHLLLLREGYDVTYVRQTWAANVRRLRRTDPDLFTS